MSSVRKFRALAWQKEFELVDDEIAGHFFRRGRAKRVALFRSGGVCGSDSRVDSTVLPELLSLMPAVPMTKHAAHRLKNRGIRLDQVLAVANFGAAQATHGATKYALDKKSRQRLAETVAADELKRLGALNIVVVFSAEGALITASHRTTRIFND